VVTFGARVDYSVPVDTYRGVVVFTVVANDYVVGPVITSLGSSYGSTAGGTSLVVVGTGLDTAYQVFVDLDDDGLQDVGEECGDANIDSETQITCVTPDATAGTYDVVVKTWGGATKTTSGTTSTTNDDFAYYAPPTVTAVSPTRQAGTTAGATVTITGTNFQIGTTNVVTNVMIGTRACTDINVTSSTSLTCAVPNQSSIGSYAVLVKTLGGDSNTNITYAYITITKIIADGSNIQSVTTTMCNNATVSATDIPVISLVKDSRDSHYYAIAKMADNKCWMLTNLAYGTSSFGIQFTSGQGTSSSASCTPSYNVWCQQHPPNNNAKQWLNPTSSYITLGSGTRCTKAYATAATGTGGVDYTECGYLYNWCAALGDASASCGVTSSNTTIANAGVGLCPTGWRLPTGGYYGEFYNLHYAMGEVNANWHPSGAWRGVYSGQFGPGYGLSGGGYEGDYWSGTVPTDQYANSLYFYGTGANPTGRNYKFSGQAVRCILN
jgi:hypothetical protein